MVPAILAKVMTIGKKADLYGKGYRKPKRKMWVTTHFSDIIKQP